MADIILRKYRVLGVTERESNGKVYINAHLYNQNGYPPFVSAGVYRKDLQEQREMVSMVVGAIGNGEYDIICREFRRNGRVDHQFDSFLNLNPSPMTGTDDI